MCDRTGLTDRQFAGAKIEISGSGSELSAEAIGLGGAPQDEVMGASDCAKRQIAL
jgi:hypothetical protein